MRTMMLPNLMRQQQRERSTRSSVCSLSFFAKAGNVGSVLLFLFTSIITAATLHQWPDEKHYDDNWLSHGYCVFIYTTTTTQPFLLLNSHTLSFGACMIQTIIIAYLYVTQPKLASPIQVSLLFGSVLGVFGHGIIHLYMGTIEPTGIDLRFRLYHGDANESSSSRILTTLCVVFVGLAMIFRATMPLASARRHFFTAFCVTAGFTILNVEPKFNFVYFQATIYWANTLQMLSLSKNDKMSAAYMLHPFLQLPVLVMGVAEATLCETILRSVGGHVAYDTTIALSIMLVELGSRLLERQQPEAIRPFLETSSMTSGDRGHSKRV